MHPLQSLGWAWHEYSVSVSSCHHPGDHVPELVGDRVPSWDRSCLIHSLSLTPIQPGPGSDGVVGLPQALRVCLFPRGVHDMCPW